MELWSDGYCVQSGIGYGSLAVNGKRIKITIPQEYKDTNYLVIASDCVPFDKSEGDEAHQAVGAMISSKNTFIASSDALADGNGNGDIYFAWETKGYIR